jgi:hypothetical protein
LFNTSILDVAIGMIFIYLLLSLLCSALNELIEVLLKKRAMDLERGIRELLQPNSKAGTSTIVKDIYDHPLINGLFEGTYENSRITSGARYLVGTKLPSYIPARNFALALMDVVLPGVSGGGKSGAAGATAPGSTDGATGATQLATLRAELNKFNDNPKLQKALTTLIDAAGNDIARARLNIEEWFNSSMDRVSGWYKRRAHVIVLVLGLLIAFWFNADSVLIVRRLASDKSLRESVVAAAVAYAQENAKPSPSPSPSPSPTASPSPRTTAASSTAGGTTPPPPTPTPTPAQTPTPTPTPTPTSSPTGAAASASASPSPTSTPCGQEECPKGSETTPQCKLAKAQCELKALGLPIGWSSPTDPDLNWDARNFGEHLKHHLFGWLLTALAISLGAPFWFDLLNKFIVIRSTVKPKEKSPEEKSKD